MPQSRTPLNARPTARGSITWYTWPSTSGTNAAGGPGRRPPRLPVLKPELGEAGWGRERGGGWSVSAAGPVRPSQPSSTHPSRAPGPPLLPTCRSAATCPRAAPSSSRPATPRSSSTTARRRRRRPPQGAPPARRPPTPRASARGGGAVEPMGLGLSEPSEKGGARPRQLPARPPQSPPLAQLTFAASPRSRLATAASSRIWAGGGGARAAQAAGERGRAAGVEARGPQPLPTSPCHQGPIRLAPPP
jgi:hypothetical protein